MWMAYSKRLRGWALTHVMNGLIKNVTVQMLHKMKNTRPLKTMKNDTENTKNKWETRNYKTKCNFSLANLHMLR